MRLWLDLSLGGPDTCRASQPQCSSKAVTELWLLRDEGNLAECGMGPEDHALPEPTSGLQPSASSVAGFKASPKVSIRNALSAQLTVSTE